jgi:hypothetical protein
MRRLTSGLAGLAMTVAGVAAGGPPAAAAVTTIREPVSFEYSDSIDCGSFRDDFTDFYTGTQTTFLDESGEPTRVLIHWKHTSNDVNSQTGYVIHEHGAFTETIDLVAMTDTVTGVLEIASKPGSGVVIVDVGRQVFDADGDLLFFSAGRSPRLAFQASDERYCVALSD